jgi:hypothetical protein
MQVLQHGTTLTPAEFVGGCLTSCHFVLYASSDKLLASSVELHNTSYLFLWSDYGYRKENPESLVYINSKISLCSCTPIILTQISECNLQVGKGTQDPYYWLVLLRGFCTLHKLLHWQFLYLKLAPTRISKHMLVMQVGDIVPHEKMWQSMRKCDLSSNVNCGHDNIPLVSE